MAKKKIKRRRRTTVEKIFIVLGLLIAISMILSLFVGLGSGSSGQPSGSLPVDDGIPIGAIEGDGLAVAAITIPGGGASPGS